MVIPMPQPPFEQRILGQMLACKYRLLEVQASGAFGTVFRGQQFFCREFMRPVAVKVSRQTGLTEDTAPQLLSAMRWSSPGYCRGMASTAT